METYIRFQTQLRCSYTGRPAGIFLAAGRIEDRPALPTITHERLREVLGWFNRNLKVPALPDSDWRCLFWFRSSSLLHEMGLFQGRLGFDRVILVKDAGVEMPINIEGWQTIIIAGKRLSLTEATLTEFAKTLIKLLDAGD